MVPLGKGKEFCYRFSFLFSKKKKLDWERNREERLGLHARDSIAPGRDIFTGWIFSVESDAKILKKVSIFYACSRSHTS